MNFKKNSNTKTFTALILILGFIILFSFSGVSRALTMDELLGRTGKVLGDSTDISFTVGQYGLKSLNYKDLVLITEEMSYAGQYAIAPYFVTGVSFQNASGTLPWQYHDQSHVRSRSVDPDGQGFNLGYAWGSVNVKFAASGGTLTALHTVTNSSTTTSITGLNMLVLRNIVPPVTPSPTGFNTGSQKGETPVLGSVTMGNYKMYIGLDIQGSVLTFGGWYQKNYPTEATMGNFPVPPGQSKQFTVSYFFADSTVPASQVASTIFQQYANANPYQLNWPDRRPVMMGMYASGSHRSMTNPRGWFNEPTKDYVSAGGSARFKTDLLSAADRTIGALRLANAQGVMLWNMEGEEFPHAVTYIGDPPNIENFAPEMTGAIDAFVQKIKDAGFKIGFTLRPQQMHVQITKPAEPCVKDDIWIKYDEPYDSSVAWRKKAHMCVNGVWNQGGLPYFQPDPKDPSQVLIDKITYAKNRWGASLFYVDSNAFSGQGPYLSEVFEKVLAVHPDVLIMPELESIRYYRTMAPYNELDLGFVYAHGMATNVWPQAFSVVNVSDGMQDWSYDMLVDSVRKGNILMGRGWFTDTSTTQVRDIYLAASDTTAPVVATTSVGSITNNSAVISWTTSEKTNAMVEYGTSPSLGSVTPVTSPGMQRKTSHTAALSNLTAGTTYHYRVVSKDLGANTGMSQIQTFTTTGGVQPIEPNPVPVPAVNPPIVVVQRKLTIDLDGTTQKAVNGTLSFINLSTKVVASSTQFTTNSSGEYTFTVPANLPSSVGIRVVIPGYLPRMITNADLLSASLITIIVPQFLAGDFNGDGVINSLDHSIINRKWNQASAAHDINRDGVINSLDYIILSRNWGSKGE